MKLLLLLFLVGYASASIYDAIDDAADEVMLEFLVGSEASPGVKRSLGFSDEDEGRKEEVVRKLREALERILEKIKESLEKGRSVREELIEKVKSLRKQLQDRNAEVTEKAKELYDRIKEKAKDFMKNILEKLGVDDDNDEVARADFNIRNIFKKLKDLIKSKIDKDALKERIEQLFGKGSEMADELLRLLKEKSEHHKNRLLEFIDRILGEEENELERRSLQEMWEKVKDYFQNLKIDIKEKYLKFGDWVKTTVRERLDKSKDKMDNIRTIAEEFVKHTKTVSKEVAVEALEFLRPYKDDMHSLWDQVKDTVKEVLGRKD